MKLLKIKKRVKMQNAVYVVGKFYSNPFVEFVVVVQKEKIIHLDIVYPKWFYEELPADVVKDLISRKEAEIEILFEEDIRNII